MSSSVLEERRKTSISPMPSQDFGLKGFSMHKRSTESLRKNEPQVKPPWKPFKKSKEGDRAQSIDIFNPPKAKRKSPPKIRNVSPLVTTKVIEPMTSKPAATAELIPANKDEQKPLDDLHALRVRKNSEVVPKKFFGTRGDFSPLP